MKEIKITDDLNGLNPKLGKHELALVKKEVAGFLKLNLYGLGHWVGPISGMTLDAFFGYSDIPDKLAEIYAPLQQTTERP